MLSARGLVGQSVWDVRGVWVGHVVDVKMIRQRTGWFRKPEEPESAGLLVSCVRAPLLMGIHRDANGKLTGLLQNLTSLLYARSKVVPWDLIESSDTGEIHLKGPATDLKRD
ncbi:hypothetical protein Aph01nite_53460 [Acrocarpospora phusangensis]|uniref:Uncharacterized protein n=1 Tax=Acrocarpospora phusangensis TaxID=1070424 RepID=A0A919QFN6_9ACTN|nr:hypothetical protein [Acrocarpospora phusangensis]GIH27036.1 hypothetical protein Aph01nite_53460 [Acrocarpospora phusangensis]